MSFLNCIRSGGRDLRIAAESGKPIEIHLHPHFTTFGGRVFSPDMRISRLGVVVDDFAAIYYDFDAFGLDVAPEGHIGEILENFRARIGRRVEPGDRPVIAYFTGRDRLFSARAPFGRVSARHQASHGMGGPRGVSINNVVVTDLDFDPSETFDQAIDNLLSLLRFLELIAGRRQNLLHIELELDQPRNCPGSILKVYWSSPPSRPTGADEQKPHPADLPLNGGVEPTEFAAVLEQWLGVDRERRDARVQFSDGFAEGNRYDTARLVSGANMFDILPASAVPKNVELPEDLQIARDEAQRIFKALPPSIERDSVLSALGRLGTATLKHKARSRGRIMLEAAGEYFPDLNLVLDESINCRNHYVHGGPAKMDYRSNFLITAPFLTNTLEFVFVASDLIEAGWKIKPWLEAGTTMSHPFGTYRVSYKDDLRVLKALLHAAAKDAPGL